MACRRTDGTIRKSLLIVLLSDETFQYCIDFIDVQRNVWLSILGVVGAVGVDVAVALHGLIATVSTCMKPSSG